MNISILISGVTGGGAEKVTCAVASYLVNHGHNVELLTMSDEEATYPLDSKVTRKCLLKECERRNFLFNNTLRFVRLVKYLLCKKPDAYLAMLPTNISTLLALRWLTKSKVIAAERANPESYTKKTQKNLVSLAHKADAWVYQTDVQKEWYNSRTCIKKGKVIPNAINPDVLNVGSAIEKKSLIVTAGRLTDQKNHLLLIESFAKIAKKHSSYNLVIYGEGPNRGILEDTISSLNLSGRVLLPGYSSDVVKSVSESSLFVLSSDYEGMPNALMEAMALGVPCVSTDCGGGGARFLIEDGKNGLLVPRQDKDALAEAMDRILSDQEFAMSLGREAHKLCEVLAPEKVYGEWEKFIKEIIEK